jgi:hypothetical protein
MTKSIDLSKPSDGEGKQHANVAPSANEAFPAHVDGPPIPAGNPIFITNPTDGERKVLTDAGWDGNSPVPDNFAEIREAALQQAVNFDTMPLPVAPDTPALKITEVALEDLPPEEQERYRTVMKSVLDGAQNEKELQNELATAAASGVTNDVLAAMRAAAPNKNQPQLVNDTADANYTTGQEKTTEYKFSDAETQKMTASTADDPDAEITPEELHAQFCSRCGFPKSNQDEVEVTQRDKFLYIQSLLGMAPMVKPYQLLDGNLSVIIRSLMTWEVDEIFKQMAIDVKKGRVITRQEELEMLNRYRMCLQLRSLELGNKPISFPATLKEWNLKESDGEGLLFYAWQRFQGSVDLHESLHRTLSRIVGDFNMTLSKLEDNSKNEDFWKAIETQSC